MFATRGSEGSSRRMRSTRSRGVIVTPNQRLQWAGAWGSGVVWLAS
jgi:hypothetical protein